MTRNHRCAPRRQAGFTLVEMLVTLTVTVVLLLAMLATFDLNSRVTKVQTNVADMQQSLRVAQDDVVRHARMAGRGGLALADAAVAPLPQGVALAIRDNVADNQLLVAGDEATRILPGTDVLTVRGVFGTLYGVNTAGGLTLVPAGNPTTGTVTVSNTSPGGAPQDLTPLQEALDAGVPEALLLISAQSDLVYAVVELTPGASVDDGNSVTLAFNISGSVLADRYGRLSTGGAFNMENAAFVGILEEHRYYVREEHVVAGDRTSDLAPKLARARFFPNTDRPYQDDAGNARLDLADNILDLQVALGFDTTNGGARRDDPDNTGPDDQLLETATGSNDDWLFNNAADNPADAIWRSALQYLRVTTLARTDRRDSQYQAPPLTRIEDRSYAANSPAVNTEAARMFRRRSLRTVIDLRNL